MIKITFLGTAAQIPTAKRNHPAVLLTYQGENLLVDCGEGTQRQFRKANLNPGKVTRILITHIHGDHVFGLPGLISTFDISGYNKTLYIYGPRGLKNFLRSFLGLEKVKRKFKIEIKEVKGKFYESGDFYLEAESMTHGIPTNAYAFVKKEQIRIDKKKLKKAKIPSSPILQELKKGKNIKIKGKTYLAKNLTYKEPEKKISFVLDTGMNKKIVPFVKESELLISESSFDSSLNDKAKEHLHLTSEQAAKIAKKSKSKKLILTHISQRYEKDLKRLLNEAKKIFKNSFLAEDLDVFEVE